VGDQFDCAWSQEKPPAIDYSRAHEREAPQTLFCKMQRRSRDTIAIPYTGKRIIHSRH
jgi:hypothetical protein